MRLLITRHGETVENKAGLLQGHNEGTLSPQGLEQARKLANRLQNENIDIIYSSDLSRAAKTAGIISEYHKEVKLLYTKQLRERNFGEFQGKKRSEIGWDLKDPESTFPEPETGESIREVYARAESFIKKIISTHISETVLLVGHGFIGKVLLAILNERHFNEIEPVEYLSNTSLSEFFINDIHSPAREILTNCTEHLNPR
jgi:broad specificity phosphatase PhoE